MDMHPIHIRCSIIPFNGHNTIFIYGITAIVIIKVLRHIILNPFVSKRQMHIMESNQMIVNAFGYCKIPLVHNIIPIHLGFPDNIP